MDFFDFVFMTMAFFLGGIAYMIFRHWLIVLPVIVLIGMGLAEIRHRYFERDRE